jgi:hypothetical protein
MAIGTNGDTCSTIAAIFGWGDAGLCPVPRQKNFLKKVFWIFKNFYEKEFANL